MTTEASEPSTKRDWAWVPRLVAAVGGAFLLGSGLWAMVAPAAFFEAAAMFEPYNAHFIRDVGAFMLGLGAVLLLAAARPAVEALAVALCGVGIGAVAHTLSHIVDRHEGGTPAVDIPFWVLLSLVLLGAGVARWRQAG
ncbi:hypothetical protein [Nitriliruptor alkaliphilus]|uniref:hypothetical protein n=1 Tax=Nitriliruptor alkaliphilus TaxID=427918 RepID=UPI0012EEBDBD|nr:hypothetical protein [Nitriliruptor alkaliphilus]